MGGTRKGNERGLVWSAEDLPALAWSKLISPWPLTVVVEPNRNSSNIIYLDRNLCTADLLLQLLQLTQHLCETIENVALLSWCFLGGFRLNTTLTREQILR